jgi:hypothetical protein
MKSNFTRIFAVAALGLIAVCASASPASAQDVFKGSFTLPANVRWGQANLPAGDYTFTLKSLALPASITVTGPNGSQFVVTSSTDQKSIGSPSRLTIERRNGERYVSEIYLDSLHMQLNYHQRSVPKGKELAMGPVSTEQVLIASAK